MSEIICYQENSVKAHGTAAADHVFFYIQKEDIHSGMHRTISRFQNLYKKAQA